MRPTHLDYVALVQMALAVVAATNGVSVNTQLALLWGTCCLFSYSAFIMRGQP